MHRIRSQALRRGFSRLRFLVLAALVSLLADEGGILHAQSVTTGAIRGTVRLAQGGDANGARVAVRNTATGFAIETEVLRGRFLVQGLETGGPYTITVRRIGAAPRRVDRVYLTLGEPFELDVTLESSPIQLDSLVTRAPASRDRSDGGTATTLGDSLVHRLPSLNRDVYDFLRLVPQLSTRIGFAPGGISGGGVGFRFNQFLTNGVSERSLGGSQPPEFANAKSLPFDAVREYQVLLAPFDVRYGDFSGAMVNTVTRSGTNTFTATGFAYGRSDALARGEDIPSYERWQYGLTFSGPIVRNRAQFLFASEFQDLTSPMAGPYVGQPETAEPPIPVSSADLARLEDIFQAYGMSSGSGGPVSNESALRNIFARVDVGLPELNSRAVLWFNDSDNRSRTFSRPPADSFALSSNAFDQAFGARTIALQLHTALERRGGGHNELSISHRSTPFQAVPEVRQPIVRVTVPATAGDFTTLITGTPVQAQGDGLRSSSVSLRDDLTLPAGAVHLINVGIESEWFRIEPGGVQNVFGTWTFPSLDSLESGQAERYEVAQDFGSGGVPLTGSQVSAYLGDHWRASDRLSLTFGLRLDMLRVNGSAPYNPLVDSLFGRRTDQGFERATELSPRLGFIWMLDANGKNAVRGGAGIFAGRPPLAWFHLPLQSYGVGIGTLRCGRQPGDRGLPPPFSPDPDNPPEACAGDAGLSGPPAGDVELVQEGAGMVRTLRAVLAYERRLPGNFLGTIEGLYTRNLSDFVFANLNLAGPQTTDGVGRVMYGSIDAAGRSRPARITDTLPGVFELQTVSINNSLQLAAGLTKEFENGLSAMASYTWSRVRDVQTPLRVNNRGAVNWGLRAVSGRHDDMEAGISLNDVTHRVVLAGTWRAPWQKWTTELSLLYVGESGSPFTYRAGGTGGRGDLNADGALNDPVYIPRSALDPDEIIFSGFSTATGADNSPAAQEARVQSQREAFEQFIEESSCLRSRRGAILERNGCREPWAATTAASLRQTVPIGRQRLEVQLDAFNVLSLLNTGWGQRRVVTNVALLEHAGQTPGASGKPEPVFRFSEGMSEWRVEPTESAFQLQLGVRYRF